MREVRFPYEASASHHISNLSFLSGRYFDFDIEILKEFEEKAQTWTWTGQEQIEVERCLKCQAFVHEEAWSLFASYLPNRDLYF